MSTLHPNHDPAGNVVMTREQLLEAIAEAKRDVASWPQWMREAVAYAPRWMVVNGQDD